MEKQAIKQRGFHRFLNLVERGGNKLPHPVVLFFILALAVMLLSLILSLAGVSAVNPATQETVTVQNILSRSGVAWIFENLVQNFTGFAPLGLVLVMMLGIGVAEETGLFSAFMKRCLLGASDRMITIMVMFIGIMGSMAADVCYIVVPPIAGMIFYTKGRHPVAGIAAAFAGVSAGFSANLLISSFDALLSGITNTAAQALPGSPLINETANWYFMMVSTLLLTVVGVIVTERFVEPRLGRYEGHVSVQAETVTRQERRGLRFAGLTALALLLLLLAAVLPNNGLLRGEGGAILHSPFMSGITVIIFLFFLLVSVAYGVGAGKIRSAGEVPGMMAASMRKMGDYIVLAFVAAQFIAFFNYTHIGTVFAIKSAEFLSRIGFSGIPLMICFVLLTAFINLFIGSGSAKWSILATVFVPMLMLMGYSPALIQLAYRIGDSATNPISPLLPYMPVIITYVEKYNQNTRLGTILSLMLPYSLSFLIAWLVLLVVWMLTGLPIGPGAPLYIS